MRKNAGFSMIELVACVALFTVVSLAALGFLSFSVNTYAAAVRDAKAMFSARLIAHAVQGTCKSGTDVRVETTAQESVLSSDCEEGTRSLRFSPTAQTLVYTLPTSGGTQDIPLCGNLAAWEIEAEGSRVRLHVCILSGGTEYSFHLTEMGDVMRDDIPVTDSETQTEEPTGQDTTEPLTEPETEPVSEAATEPETESETEPETEPQTEPISEAYSEVETSQQETQITEANT